MERCGQGRRVGAIGASLTRSTPTMQVEGFKSYREDTIDKDPIQYTFV